MATRTTGAVVETQTFQVRYTAPNGAVQLGKKYVISRLIEFESVHRFIRFTVHNGTEVYFQWGANDAAVVETFEEHLQDTTHG